MMKPVCIIPAKARSRRFPGKNVALLRGKPLLAYTVEAALGSGVFARVLVSTDVEEIRAVALRFGAEVPGLRPAELAGDAAGVVDVCVDLLERLAQGGESYERLGVLLPTAPLRSAEDVRRAWELFRASRADFLMAVTTFDPPPYWALKEQDGYLDALFDREYLLTTRELPPALVDNGAIYLVRVPAFLRQRTFYGRPLIGYRMPRDRSVDVDEPFDLVLAEFLLERLDGSEAVKAAGEPR